MAISTLAPDILTAKQRRLHELERRAAQLGYATPPETATEIQEIRADIAGAEPAERHAMLYDLLMETRTDVRRLYWLMPILMVLLCAFMVILVK